jgi:type IV pilus assembly protein PilX
VLIVGLILLMVITLLALAGIQGVSLQERMSGNAYDRNLAFQSAEAALRYAEDKLMASGTLMGGVSVLGPEPNFTDDKFRKESIGNNSTWKQEVPVTEHKVPAGSIQPRFTALRVTDQCAKVSAIGVGRSKYSVVVLQSIVCNPDASWSGGGGAVSPGTSGP